MDGIVIYFNEAQLEDVCKELSTGLPESSVFPYRGNSWMDELNADEIERIVQMLGNPPTCAVAVACHHGPQAREALCAVAKVMSKFPSSILNDDFGHLWTSQEIVIAESTKPLKGLFALRTAG